MPDTSNARADRPRSPRVGIGTMLMLVALVPLVGFGVVTWRSVRDAELRRAAAEHTREHAEEIIHVVALDAAVFDELIWNALVRVLDELGLDPDAFDGFEIMEDPDVEVVAARARTDELARTVNDPLVYQGVARARQRDGSLAELLAEYGQLAYRVDELLTDSVRGLTVGDDEEHPAATFHLEVGRSIDMLESSIDVRRGVTSSVFAFYATVWDVRERPPVELGRLIALRDEQRTGLDHLSEIGDGDPEVAAAVAQVTGDPVMETFFNAVEDFIAGSLRDGVPDVGSPINMVAVLENYQAFAALYEAAMQSTTITADLLEVSSQRIDDAIDEAVDEAAAEEREALALALLLTAATVMAAIAAGAFIVRPLRALRRSADSLRDPDGLATEPVGGPIEVHAAGEAIADAAAHLELVVDQTRALAAGDLDAEVLEHEQEDGLGTDVQRAVGRLRSALATQDEFRRRLAHEASHDGLTKIANRNSSMAQLQRSLARTSRAATQLAVLFIDLDRFKDVNDRHGHGAGDHVLTTVAKRLVHEVREGDHVGRLGGDEFVVIAEPIEGVLEAMDLAERLREAVAEKIRWGDVELRIGSSIGIAIANGSELTAEELLHDADLAVYRAKADGRYGVVVCDEELRRELAESADLTSAIRRAIRDDEFVMHYQPIVDAVTHQVLAYEALVRWIRPDRDTPVPPDEFIGFAERSDLIIDLDCWVLDAVTAQVAAWRSDARYAGVPVSINVSGRHLANDRFVQHVLTPIERHEVDPGLVIIEVTESALLEDLPVAAARLEMLRSERVRVAIDDFGTGYTSLAHLRALPIDTLKIDRSFIRDDRPDGSSLLKLIIDTGHLLGATVTAEGVETLEEVRRLASLGSDALQGYFFARPEPYRPEVLSGLNGGAAGPPH